MAALDKAFGTAFRPVLAALSKVVGKRLRTRVTTGAGVRVEGATVNVGQAHVDHFSRFGSLPTRLIEECAAQALSQANPGWDEAEVRVQVEAFLRDAHFSQD